MRSLLIATLAGYSSLANAACTRDGLTKVMDAYLDSALKKTAFPVDPSVKISENNAFVTSLAQTAHSNFTVYYKPNFRINVLDTEFCEVASYVSPYEGDPADKKIGLLSTRIKVPSDTGLPTEIEILNELKEGSVGNKLIFRPSAYPDQIESYWSTPNNTLSRTELIAAANSYCDGVQSGDGSAIPAGPDCPRLENGVETSKHCNKQLFGFKWPVTDRRWIADEVTGIVWGSFWFDMPKRYKVIKTGLYLHEFFAVKGGKLIAIDANMKYMNGPYVDVWGTAATNSSA
jgi:hypothetical protein